jgi:YD repeat-containing protein
VTTFGYDPTSGALATITGSDGIVVASTYDGSLLASETWSGPVAGSVSRTYTSRLTPATETVAGTAAIPFAYDDDGLLIGAGALAIMRDADNGVPTASALGIVAESRTRDVRGHVATVAVQANATPRYAATYTRDAAGRVTQKAETVGGVTTTLGYTYDATGRLTDVTTNGAATEHYVYDTNGNRTGATVRGTTITASYDARIGCCSTAAHVRLRRHGCPRRHDRRARHDHVRLRRGPALASGHARRRDRRHLPRRRLEPSHREEGERSPRPGFLYGSAFHPSPSSTAPARS